jgi:diguanylate cyclase (GGDEF)-like protein
MRALPQQYRLLVALTLILIGGFMATTVVGYIASRDAVEQGISTEALPLTGDNIYSEIQKDMLQPVFISSLMANDTFVRDWILRGEQDSDQIVRYLKEVKQKYGTLSSFLISEKTRKYYYGEGTLKSIREDEPRDVWFFRVRQMSKPYEINVDFDMANRDTITIFINHRVLDYKGNFIGVTGVGLTLDTMAQLIDRYRSRFQRDIYFVDPAGNIVLTGKSMQNVRGSIFKLPGISAIANDILNQRSAPTDLRYQKANGITLLNSRFIPELGWYLVVEQDVGQGMKPVHQVFALNMAISAVVTALVLAIILLTVNRYQRRIEKMAATDGLTGLLNRQALKVVFRQYVLSSKRSGHALSAILFDIDLFKRVNDTYGHLAGDGVICAVAKIAAEMVRESDVVARWGGEEFLILLHDCTLGHACTLAEELRAAVERHAFGLRPDAGAPTGDITISLGVAQFIPEETPTSFFARADVALYEAKEAGRNCAAVSDPDPATLSDS